MDQNDIILNPFLLRGERILWSGKPDGGIHFKTSDLKRSMFFVFFAGFAVFWMIMASQSGGIFWMFGLPFLFVGLNGVIFRYFREARARKHTLYAVTDERVLILKKGKNLTAVPIREITELHLHLDSNTLGTIYLGPKSRITSPRNAGMRYRPQRNVLEFIENPNDVMKIIEENREQNA